MPSRENRRLTAWLMPALKLLVIAMVAWFVGAKLFDAWRQLRQHAEVHPWHADPGWLAVSGGFYLLALLPAWFFWRHVLRALGQDARLGETLRAYYIGHLGKYVPGKAMVVVLRTGLVQSHRIDTTVAAVTVFVETLTMISVGSFLAAAYLAVHPTAYVGVQSYGERLTVVAAAVGLMAVAGLPTFPPIFRRLVRLPGIAGSNPPVAEKLDRLRYRTLLLGWALMAICWILMGLSCWATLRSMGFEGLDPIGDLPRYTAGVALATVAGFIVLFIPAGLGVRDVLLASFLTPYLIDATRLDAGLVAALAIVAALLLRVVWLLSELGISAILYVVGLRGR
jgi:glycosyltransferase 2 family protein